MAKVYEIEKAENGLVVFTGVTVPEVLLDESGKGVQEMIDIVRSKTANLAFDVTDSKQREEAKSLAYRVSRTKTAFATPAAEFSKDLKEQPKIVDRNRKLWADAMDAIRDDIRGPIVEWEAEQERKRQEMQERIEAIRHEATLVGVQTADELRGSLENATKIYDGFDFGEYSAVAERAYSETIESINAAIKAREEADAKQAELEAAQAELERLRKQEEDRLHAEQQEAAKREAAEQAARQAKIDAEEAHKREMERIEAERVAEREAAERKAREAQEAAEQAERDRLQAIEDAKQEAIKAEQDRIAALERAEIEKQEAIEAERKRVADEKAKAEAEAAKREADIAHHRKINNEAVACLIKAGLTEDQAKIAITAIANREVQHVTIAY